ncbi:FAD dependent oxidoreductase [Coniophora puteana RWD-64-598 SS2]|uniref:FAD dependent oxidoreductase n=1 Tax=Coniophora puteana (strain RWD-64-598) TaxID=741705 RepID=A0A5M3MNM0_CONPW|nr:FAD dependent oxidoreductase [Coniophora puteana RWD-64-598 SS2]EIW80713.1 FAD dependent oxidoreductase [Coniophora puteana RWD-64-598 SS2]
MSGEPTSRSVLIVGAGCYGLSTALHLLRRGYKDVTILDRAEHLPAQDAASTDINKIVRSCYNDIFYTKLAREAISAWKSGEWDGCYHESGAVTLCTDYQRDTSYLNDIDINSPLPDSVSVCERYPSALRESSSLGTLSSASGFFNKIGGWAEAERAVKIALDKVKSLGANVTPGKTVTSLVKDGGRTSGVICSDGTTYRADVVVLALGAWSSSAVPELKLDERCLAAGQTVATVQLEPEEFLHYKDCPVTLDFRTGFYVFPPTSQGVVKFAIHSAGYTNSIVPSHADDQRAISTPRTVLSHNEDGLRIPATAAKQLRMYLAEVYPELAKKPFLNTRMCWYTDSPDGNWVIGYYPNDAGLVLATGGSGHGFKFLPTIGAIVADALEHKLDDATKARFAVDRGIVPGNSDRAAYYAVLPQELDVTQLWGARDLAGMWEVLYLLISTLGCPGLIQW